MAAEQKTHFKVDKSKCIRCGKWTNTCSGMVIAFGKDSYPEMKMFEMCSLYASVQIYNSKE